MADTRANMHCFIATRLGHDHDDDQALKKAYEINVSSYKSVNTSCLDVKLLDKSDPSDTIINIIPTILVPFCLLPR